MQRQGEFIGHNSQESLLLLEYRSDFSTMRFICPGCDLSVSFNSQFVQCNQQNVSLSFCTSHTLQYNTIIYVIYCESSLTFCFKLESQTCAGGSSGDVKVSCICIDLVKYQSVLQLLTENKL